MESTLPIIPQSDSEPKIDDRPSVPASEVEHSAALAYNKMFDEDEKVRKLEEMKQNPSTRDQALWQQKMMLQTAEYAAMEQIGYDQKTQILNAFGLNSKLVEAAAQINRENLGDQGESWVVLFLDINWFKKFNDELGQADGDDYLISIAKILTNCVRDGEGDLVARHGGEEFIIVVRLKPGSNIKQIMEEGSDGNKSIIERISSGILALRNEWVKKRGEVFYRAYDDNGKETNLYEMGVGTLAGCYEHLSSSEIAQRYRQWDADRKAQITERDFVNYSLIEAIAAQMKRVVKPRARYTQVPFMVAQLQQPATLQQ